MREIFILFIILFSSTIDGKSHRSYQSKAEFKRTHLCPSTNQPKGKCPGYIIDHIIAIKRGGEDKPFNMQWQTIEESKQKDLWE